MSQLITISGPSGVGKDTVWRGVEARVYRDPYLNRYVVLEDRLDGVTDDDLSSTPSSIENTLSQDPLTRRSQLRQMRSQRKQQLVSPVPIMTVKSWTTRPMKPGESMDAYHFVTQAEFIVNLDAMLEYAVYGGNYYGTNKNDLLDALEHDFYPIKQMETQGVGQVLASDIPASVIFIDAPLDVLEARLRMRGRDDDIAQRLEIARREKKFLMKHASYMVENKGDITYARNAVYNIILEIIQKDK